ncbi:MAG: hypothetical protein CME06_08065 [Gemmatimonadetes bacterium]|nr:hypothetical protein [Gemmatimonadota bacterium]
MNALHCLIVCRAESKRVMRGKRGLVLAALYLGFYLFWGNILAKILSGAQDTFHLSVSFLGFGSGNEAPSLFDLLGQGAGGELAGAMAGVPATALFFLVTSYLSLPLLATLMAYDSIADDLRSGSIRYTLTRCGRTSYLAGKALGQIALLSMLTGACAMAMLALGAIREVEPGWIATLPHIFRYWFVGIVFGSVFVGAAILISTVASSPGTALLFGVLSLVFGFLVWIAGPEAVSFDFSLLAPYAHWRRLLIPDQVVGGTAIHAAFALGLLGAAAVALERRDV